MSQTEYAPYLMRFTRDEHDRLMATAKSRGIKLAALIRTELADLHPETE